MDSLREESKCDAFDTGPVQLQSQQGLVMWPQEKANRSIITLSVIGDGSMTSGMAYEALNNASD